jgi:hypothetical protein
MGTFFQAWRRRQAEQQAAEWTQEQEEARQAVEELPDVLRERARRAVDTLLEGRDEEVAGALARGQPVVALESTLIAHGLPMPELVVEPGRSIAGPAGTTLYRVGSIKRAADGTVYAAVDGGMSDNPRPQLYGARVTALVAGRADAPPDGSYAVSGKHCESGDVLAWDVPLAAPRHGDLLAVPATGAYTLAMSSTYNSRLLVPEVLASGGRFAVIRARPSYDAMLGLDAIPDFLADSAEETGRASARPALRAVPGGGSG